MMNAASKHVIDHSIKHVIKYVIKYVIIAPIKQVYSHSMVLGGFEEMS